MKDAKLGQLSVDADVIPSKARSDQARRAGRASAENTRVRGGRIMHPTTAEIEYSPDEMEFHRAVQEFQFKTGRKFPTWSDVLRIVRSLGYEKPEAAQAMFSLDGPLN